MKNIFMLLILLSAVTFAQRIEKNLYNIEREILKGAPERGSAALLQFKISDGNGNLLRTIQVKSPHDIPYPAPGIFNDGTFFLLWSFNCSIDFYGRGISKISTIKLIKDAGPEYERAIYYDASEIAVFAVSEPKRENVLITTIDRSGSRLAEWESEFRHIEGIKTNKEGTLIAASLFSWNDLTPEGKTIIFDNSGSVQTALDDRFTNGSFAYDDKIFIGQTNKSIFVASLSEGVTKLRYEPAEGSVLIDYELISSALLLLESAKVELQDGKWIYRKPTVKRLDEMENSALVIFRSDKDILSPSLKAENGNVILSGENFREIIK